MPADDYGRTLPAFTVNLLSADLERSARFYAEVLGARIVYRDVDFIALEVAGLAFMVHADHTYENHPWSARLALEKTGRGLGAEIRLLGVDPDAIEARARAQGATVLQAAEDKPHGWRDTIVCDPDGYAWAVGRVK
ncbi:MAG TPA: VOC family protein [Candidatus Acidoferrales bacterium]|nr:VOC family protein [Candidatus Acidoferrales bacterium]